MYKIYADDKLIYDSTLDDYKIGKGSVTLETNKSGSFTFSVYPDHFYYDKFVKLKTVITVYKSNKIVFRGRILNDVTDYWNNRVITCEGELGFLQDSVIRPFDFTGTPEELFIKFITDHNAQVDEFKRFKIGTVTVIDPNNYIARSNEAYESAFSNLNSRLVEGSLGGYISITHGEDGTDPIPTIHYLADFSRISTQTVEFGSNLKNYTKTVKAEDIATEIIPLGTDDLTIESVNNGLDYVSNDKGIALYGRICKVVKWDDVTEPSNLLSKAKAYLDAVVNQSVSIELNAIDLHLLDKSIDTFGVNDYVRVVSAPHDIADTYLCHKQTIDLLKPENDTITLGASYSTFTQRSIDSIAGIQQSVTVVSNKVNKQSNAFSADILDLNEKTAQYKIAEQQLASLLTQSFGVFRSEEMLPDGSFIYYMHDKPTLEESTIIWKMTENAFAVSTDGGNTWNAGLDAEGNALVNVLSAIGIEANWINANNLNAISANIGGWKIDNRAIYKDVIDPNDSNIVNRVYFQPPLDTGVKTWVLSCQRSENGGKSFTGTFVLYSDGSAKFGTNTTINADGSAKFGMMSILADGTVIWKDEDTGEYIAQITKQSDGTMVLSVDDIRLSDVRPSVSIRATDTDDNAVTLQFQDGLLLGVY